MFIELANYPLPLKLGHATVALQRRHYAGPIDLRSSAFASFTQVVEELLQAPAEMDADQLACTARSLMDRYPGRHSVPCISARMRLIVALRALIAESSWELPPEAATLIHRLLAYHDRSEHLIPTGLPVLGHLDDAVLLDAVWPRIRDDMQEYMDFRRLRRIEAELGGVRPSRLPFTRQDWLVSREVEHKLRAQFHRSGLGRYTSGVADAPRFTVH